MKKTLPQSQKGSIAVLVALLLPMFIGFMALAIDVGYIVLNRQRMQVAADSAALVAAGALQRGLGLDSAQSLAFQATTANGFANNIESTQVLISIPPGGSESFSNDDQFVRVTVSQPINVFLAWIFGIIHIPTTAMAVSGPTGSGLPCMLTLQTNVPDALYVGGTAQLSAVHCGIYVNSTHEGALDIVKPTQLIAATIHVVGGCDGKVCDQILNLTTNALPIEDPFSGMDKPPSTTCIEYKEIPGKELSLTPGTYCTILKLNSSSIVHFASGTYFLKNGLEVTSDVNLEGNGVTFYNDGSDSKSGSFKLTGSGIMNFTAPISGDYPGMLFLQDPLNTQEASINGNTSSSFAGNFYFPNNALKLGGKSTSVIKIGAVVVS